MSGLVTAVCRCGHRYDHHRDAGDPRGGGCWRCECAEYDGARLQAAKHYPRADVTLGAARTGFIPLSRPRLAALHVGKSLEWVGAQIVAWVWGDTRW